MFQVDIYICDWVKVYYSKQSQQIAFHAKANGSLPDIVINISLYVILQ